MMRFIFLSVFFSLIYSQPSDYVKFKHIKFTKYELTNSNKPTSNCQSCLGEFDKLNIINCYKLDDNEINCHTDEFRYNCKYNCKYEFNLIKINCEKNQTIHNELYIIQKSCILTYSLKSDTNVILVSIIIIIWMLCGCPIKNNNNERLHRY